MIETVVVDLGGVAARFLPERRLEALASLSGLPVDLIQARLFDSGLERRAELGEYNSDQIIAPIQAALGQPVDQEALIDAWSLAFEPNDAIIELVTSLSLPSVIFTNNGPMIDACLAGPLRGLAASFSDVICSWHLKAVKPEVAAYFRAAERLKCRPDQLLLLDDSAPNVAAAIQFGWHAETVSSLEDVAAVLAKYCKP